MLRKLIKYEWKDVYKVGLLLVGALALATLVGFLATQTPMWSELFGESGSQMNDLSESLLWIVGFFAFFLYTMMLMGVVYGIFIYLTVHFYKTMYTDEGYLLHTLPVTKHQILISKILVSSLWVYIIYIAMLLSLAIFALGFVGGVTSSTFPELLQQIAVFLESVWPEMLREMGPDGVSLLIHYAGSMGLLMLLGIPSGLLCIFGATSLGQLFPKHRVLMSILCYAGIMIAEAMITGILGSVISAAAIMGASAVESFSLGLHSLAIRYDVSLFIHLLMAVGLYMVSYYVTSRKLNMD